MPTPILCVGFHRHGAASPATDGYHRSSPYGQHSETCPMHALQAWLKLTRFRSGRVFRAVDSLGNR
ncbi:MAG: hypothetical protein OHK0015_07200 [Chloroflexi bacterium OHK40]